MRRLKLALLTSAALFAVACATATNTGTTTGTGNASGANSAAAGPPAPPASPGAAASSARATYDAACVKCHKENGEGGVAELDEGTKITVPSFKEDHSIEHTDADFVRKITNGDKEEGMPAFKDRLTPEQINELVRFIRSEFQAGGPKEGAGH